MKFFVLFTLLSVGVLRSHSLSAYTLDPEGALALEVHGFVSQGFIKTTGNNYIGKSKRGSFEFTEVGINFTKPLTENLRTGMQLFARKLGARGDYSAKMDWFYLDYRWNDSLGFRAGRVKLPFGLYNEINDIDQARVPILLPQSVYPAGNRDYLLAQTGAEAYGRLNFGEAGLVDYRLYSGTIFVDTPPSAGSSIQVTGLNVPYIIGSRLLWETPVTGLRTGGSIQYLRLDADVLYDSTITGPLIAAGELPTGFNGKVSAQIPILLWVGSVEYTMRDVLIAAEYSRWHIMELKSDQPALLPDSNSVSERFYIMGDYRLNNWFHPGAYYSALFPNADKRGGKENGWHDIAASFRFDINSFWLVKVEGHYMRGTAGLTRSLNGNKPLTDLEGNWGALLIKTTVYF